MTSHECVGLIKALEESRMADLAGFKIRDCPMFIRKAKGNQCEWDVILIPLIERIFLLREIYQVIDKLDIDVAMFTDINRPGCVIFH